MADKKVTVVLSAKDEASKVLNKLGSTLKTTVVAGAAAAAAGLAALTVALNKLSEAAVEQIEVDIRLEQAIKNAGLEMDVVLPKLKAHQSGLQRITKFGDETTSTIQSLLISLGGLRDTSAIERTTEATLDFASATGVEVKAAALLFAKAAQGEVSALSRYGLILDQSIPKTEKFGALLELTERQFGGVAQAIGERLPGQMAGFRNDLSDSIQALGQAIFETKGYTSANETLRDSIRSLTDLINANKDSIGEWVTGITESIRSTIAWTIEHKKLIKTIGETAVILGTIAIVKSLAASMAVLTTATIVSTKATIAGTKAIIAYGSAQGFLNAKFAGATPLIKSVAVSLGGLAKILSGAVLIAAAAVAVKIALMTREMNKLQEIARRKEIESFSQELMGIRGSADAYIQAGGNIVKATERIRAVMQSTGATLQRDFGERFEAALAIETIQKKFGDDAQKIIDAAKRMSQDGVVSLDRLNAATLLFEKRQGNLAPAIEKVIEPAKAAAEALETFGEAIFPELPPIGDIAGPLEAGTEALKKAQLQALATGAAVAELGAAFRQATDPEVLSILGEQLVRSLQEVDPELGAEAIMEKFREMFPMVDFETLAEDAPFFAELLRSANPESVGMAVGDALTAAQGSITNFTSGITNLQNALSVLGVQGSGGFGRFAKATAKVQAVISTAQAIFEIAQAIAAIARFDFGAAAQHGLAAAKFQISAQAGKSAEGAISAQEGGFVPMLPGAVAGQDSVAAMLTPGELIIPTPFAQEFGRTQGFQDGGVVGGDLEGAPAGGVVNVGVLPADPSVMGPLMDAISEAVERFGFRMVASEIAA